MKIILQNNTELQPLSIVGKPQTIQGSERDCLSFYFPSSIGLDFLNSIFTSINCESIRLIEDDGIEHIYTGYTIRASLTLIPSNNKIEDDQIVVTMAQCTYIEKQLLTIQYQAEQTIKQITDIQLALCEVYETMTINNKEQEENDGNG